MVVVALEERVALFVPADEEEVVVKDDRPRVEEFCSC